MSEHETPNPPPTRPPTSGPGSGVDRWRAYAAAVTASPVESWAELSREEIVELLESEGATSPAPTEQPAEPTADPAAVDPPARVRRARPQWMVPTADGMVPESEHERRARG